MKIITAPEEYKLQDGEISVFLAGGITNCPIWQNDIIKRLKQYGENLVENLVIFNPRRENFPIDDPTAAYKQIDWEFRALEKADIFSMYFSSGISDQPICMYELGRNIVKMQINHSIDWKDRIIISVENGYKRKQDVLIQTEFACGDLFVNTQISENVLKDYHADLIIKSYKRLNGR